MSVNGEEDQGLHSGAPHKLEAGDEIARDVKKEQPVRWEENQGHIVNKFHLLLLHTCNA